MMIVPRCRRVVGLLMAATLVLAQDYGYDQDYTQDYAEDNLYHKYAAHQQEKAQGGGGGGMGKALIYSALAWLAGGKIHSSRATKKMKTRFQKEQKALYSQYYNDVYKLTEQNNELTYYVEQLQTALKDTEQKAELEALQRDYEEFKQPDIDGDDRISRAEFNMYVKNYLSNYPGLAEKDYPKFEDFDHDGDGYVSFQEYAQQMALQVQQAELEQSQAQQQGGGKAEAQRAQALQGLYGEAKRGGGGAQDFYGNYH